ncbi:MAG: hypothetical protein ACW986_14495 [Promethearchaeota archaeon]
MRYIRNQYVRAGSFMWWVFILIISGAAIGGGSYLLQFNWAGIFPIIIGILILYRLILGFTNRSKLRDIVLHEFEKDPDSSVKDLRMRTGLSRRDVRAIILELKLSGHYTSDFSTHSGRVHVIAPHNELNPSETKAAYCESCGTPIRNESDQYCSYCGAKI